MSKHTQFYIEQLSKEAGIIEDVQNYRPLNTSDAITKGMPIGAAIGAGAGLINGITEDPGYDPETGKKKSKIKQIIMHTLAGTGIGATAAGAIPMALKGGFHYGGKALEGLGNLASDNGIEDLGDSLSSRGGVSQFIGSHAGEGLRVQDMPSAASGLLNGEINKDMANRMAIPGILGKYL